jgi:hypothetical protein
MLRAMSNPFPPGPAHVQHRSWIRRHWVLVLVLTLVVLGVLALGACLTAIGSALDEADGQSSTSVEPAPAASAPAGEDDAGQKPDGVYAFGETVRFEDGSTLVASAPVKFTRDEFAFGGDDYKHHVKVKVTFTNNSDKVFDPALTTGAMSSGEREGDSVFQDGLDAPENKLLPGKKVTWWMGYGVDDPKRVTLTVSMGFLDYDDVIFTNE